MTVSDLGQCVISAYTPAATERTEARTARTTGEKANMAKLERAQGRELALRMNEGLDE